MISSVGSSSSHFVAPTNGKGDLSSLDVNQMVSAITGRSSEGQMHKVISDYLSATLFLRLQLNTLSS
jgi:hypothetical protein